MIKKFCTICFILLSLQIFSQNVETMKSTARFSTDAELTSYINKAKSSGLSLIEAISSAWLVKASHNIMLSIASLASHLPAVDKVIACWTFLCLGDQITIC